MAGPWTLCQCRAFNCVEDTCIDPNTGQTVPGRILNRPTYKAHRDAEEKWIMDRRELDVINAITSATLMNIDSPDASVTAHQGAHSYARSQRTVAGAQETVNSEQPHSSPEDIGPENRTEGISNSTKDTLSERASDTAQSYVFPSRENIELQSYYNALLQEISEYKHPSIVFEQAPTSLNDTVPALENLYRTPRQRISNAQFLHHREKLSQLSQLVEEVQDHADPTLMDMKQKFRFDVSVRLRLLDALVESQWEEEKTKLGFTSSGGGGGAPVYDTASLFDLDLGQTPLVILLSIMAAFTLHLYHGLSRNGASFLLQATQLIASAACLAAFAAIGQSSAVFAEWTRLWPTDIRTALKTFQLDPECVQYACCKRCCACYPAPYPQYCTHKETPDSQECGARLLSDNGSDSPTTPIRRFIYQPFQTWLARLLSRPGIEEVLIAKPSPSDPQLERDVWDGKAFEQFKGPDGKPYFEASGSELRLVFSLFVDWFNPYGNRASSSSTSIGAIYMVCLNLPPHLRYRMENIYLVGIIPGPKEPSLHQINHFFAILVSDLLPFWTNGVQFTRTASHRHGRLIRCALLPLVCDLPALRKAAGLAGHGATLLCSFCLITKETISNLAFWDWPRRTFADHLRQARQWRDAPSEDLRKTLWAAIPIRWTELLRLPYWDVTKYAVLDAMHNLFLGHFRRHCVDIWHMQAPKEQDLDTDHQSKKKQNYHTEAQQAASIEAAITALQEQAKTKLDKIRVGYLIALARANGVPLDDQPTRKTVVQALLSWRARNPHVHINGPAPYPYPVKDFSNPVPVEKEPVLKEDILAEVWQDIAATTLPSWLGRAPKRFGAPGQGRLKADQWRTACTVHLPITLIRLWHHLPDTQREKALLRNFVALVTAVLLATRRSTSQFHRTVIQNSLIEYLRTLVELFGPGVLVTNHHISLHLVECLELFGPVHGWWAFPFERFNGILQGFNSNSRIGQLELTFFTTFCRAANFKALMATTPLIGLVGKMRSLFLAFFPPARTGTLANDLLAFESQLSATEDIIEDNRTGILEDIPNAHYHALIERINRDIDPMSPQFHSYDNDASPPGTTAQPQAAYCSYAKLLGVMYSTWNHSLGDSMVVFRPGTGVYDRAGRIRKMFVHTRPSPTGNPITEHFAVVDPFLDLAWEEKTLYDPYHHYPFLGIRLCHDRFDLEPTVIKVSDIVSHIASCPYRNVNVPRFRVVVSLSRD